MVEGYMRARMRAPGRVRGRGRGRGHGTSRAGDLRAWKGRLLQVPAQGHSLGSQWM